MSGEAFTAEEIRFLKALIVGIKSAIGPSIAPDHDLDGGRGDPEVRLDVRDWKGAPCKGRRMSDCPPEFLEMLADTLDWMADNPREGKEKFTEQTRRDAARARGWAKRGREELAKTQARPAQSKPNGAPPRRLAPGEDPFA